MEKSILLFKKSKRADRKKKNSRKKSILLFCSVYRAIPSSYLYNDFIPYFSYIKKRKRATRASSLFQKK
jgi:hypothetical protein